MTQEIVEVKEYKKLVIFVQERANAITIIDEAGMKEGADLLDAIKKVETSITDRKEAITRPLMTALASARDLFKPLEVGHAEAKKTIKAKMLEYTVAESERIEKEKARIEARVEKGTMRTDTAVQKLEDLYEITTFSGAKGTSTIRKQTRLRVYDESMIPREYLVPDLVKIGQAVLREGKEVPGVETYQEKSIVINKR